jgi:molybdate transport system substrate-binding protein
VGRGFKRWAATLALGGALLVACSSTSSTSGTTTTTAASTSTTNRIATTVAPTTTTPPVAGTATIFAASSLTAAFTDMGNAFHALYPKATVKFNFNGSPTLVTQISQGAPADVFASADTDNLQRLVDSGLTVGTPRIFTKNLLQIVVAKGNPKGVVGLADLARSDLVVILCAPAVPCGHYANQALANAGVVAKPVSLEPNVKSLIGKIALGEADIGIGYVTDVVADNRVSGVVIPANQNIVASYPLAALRSSTNPVTAQAFVNFVLSAQGQAIMAKYGFLGI